ncbi:MAG: hypothetical protein ACREQC_14580, partial [Candidatus Binataceae bacterium]
MNLIRAFLVCLALTATAAGAAGQATNPAPGAVTGLAQNAPSLPIGTVITAQNWNQYKEFMPDGMIKLFAGEYSLKIPSDVQMEIGPTIIHPLPKG